MGNFELLQERANDCLVQTRTDRRSLATLVKYFYESGRMITSTSMLVRSIIEELRRRVLLDGAEDILSYEDADRIVSLFQLKGLNSADHQKSTYLRQLGKEDLFLEGVDLSYAMKPRVNIKILEAQRKEAEHDKELLKAQAEQELCSNTELQKVLAQRKEEDKKLKEELAIVPENLIAEED